MIIYAYVIAPFRMPNPRLIKYSMFIYAYIIAPFRTPNPSLIKYSMFIYAYVIAPFRTSNPLALLNIQCLFMHTSFLTGIRNMFVFVHVVLNIQPQVSFTTPIPRSY